MEKGRTDDSPAFGAGGVGIVGIVDFVEGWEEGEEFPPIAALR